MPRSERKETNTGKAMAVLSGVQDPGSNCAITSQHIILKTRAF